MGKVGATVREEVVPATGLVARKKGRGLLVARHSAVRRDPIRSVTGANSVALHPEMAPALRLAMFRSSDTLLSVPLQLLFLL